MSRVAEESEMAEPTVEEVSGSQAAHLLVIRHDPGDLQVGEDARDVHHRLAEPKSASARSRVKTWAINPSRSRGRIASMASGSVAMGVKDHRGPRLGEGTDAPHDVPVVGQAVAEDQADADRGRCHAPMITRDANSEQISAIEDGDFDRRVDSISGGDPCGAAAARPRGPLTCRGPSRS